MQRPAEMERERGLACGMKGPADLGRERGLGSGMKEPADLERSLMPDDLERDSLR